MIENLYNGIYQNAGKAKSMKKTIMTIVFLLLMISAACADEIPDTAGQDLKTAPGDAVISTEVPETHRITVKFEGDGSFKLGGQDGNSFDVERLSEPEIEIAPNDGKKITKVLINGVDITSELTDGKYKLEPVFKDGEIIIRIETKDIPSTPDDADDKGSDKKDGKNDGKNPGTGDGNNPLLLFALAGISMAGYVMILRQRKKNN